MSNKICIRKQKGNIRKKEHKITLRKCKEIVQKLFRWRLIKET